MNGPENKGYFSLNDFGHSTILDTPVRPVRPVRED